jgi:predicted P-loop ATPase
LIEITHKIDVTGIEAAREQLFAEATARYREGEDWWPSDDEQQRYFDGMQRRIEEYDLFVELLYQWVSTQTGSFSTAQAAKDGLSLATKDLTAVLVRRVVSALRKIGCIEDEQRSTRVIVFWRPPLIGARDEDKANTVPPTEEADDGVDF